MTKMKDMQRDKKRKLDSQSANDSSKQLKTASKSTSSTSDVSEQIKIASQLSLRSSEEVSISQEIQIKTSANITYSFSFKDALNFYPVLNFLEENFLFEIHMIMACESATDNNINKFVITKETGEVYSYWPSKNLKPKLIENLCGKNIKSFIPNHKGGIFALTNEGEVYFWGNKWGNLRDYMEPEECNIFSEPTLVTDLSNKNIVDIVCTRFRAFARTVNEKVYVWEWDILDDMETDDASNWKQLECGKKNKNIVYIASDSFHGIMVTDNGEVYNLSYDDSKNEYKMDGRFTFSSRIVKVACGYEHSLALTDKGDLYVWGKNDNGQLGIGKVTDIAYPVLLNTSEIGKLLDVAAVNTKHISVAINEYKCVYVWGLYDKCKILTPFVTFHENMYDVFAYEKIMYKPLILSADYTCVNKESNIMRCLKDVFDDPSTSDFRVQVQGQDIHVHKIILRMCSSHFRTMFQHIWTDNAENVLKLDKFSYDVYKAYFKYCYTGVIDIPPKELLDLSKLADLYDEINLKKDCFLILQKAITKSNVGHFYSKAIKYEDKRLEELCFSFALKHMTEVVQTNSFKNLDENTKTMFIIKAAKAGAFKT